MPTSLAEVLSVVAVGVLLAASSASANPVHIRDGMAVDRAGNTFVPLVSAFRSAAVVLDASGQIAHCGPSGSVEVEARPRRDGPGFLVLRRDLRLSLTLERWDAQGRVEWRFETSADAFAATADGGAVLLEEVFGQPPERARTQMVRLGANGELRWRTTVFSSPDGWLDADLREDHLGRIHFATEPQGLFIIQGPNGTARLGMVNADGRLGWLVEEPRSSLTPVRVLDDGRGDLWWYIGPGFFTSRGVPYRASQLQRWTPWGLPLASFDGPALVPGTEIGSPALDGGDAVWYLASRDFDPTELVRIGTSGREARHAIEFDIDIARNDHRDLLVQMAAGDGSAWVAGWSADVADRLKVQRYSNTGLAWTRYLAGGDEVRGLVVTTAGDARLAASNAARSGWIASIAARRGEEYWRVSTDSIFRTCQAR